MAIISNIQTDNLSFQNDFFLIPASLFHIGYEKALVLTRIQYWIKVSGHKVEGEEGLWIYNSIKKWHEQFSCFSQYKIKKIISSLEKDGLLISKKVNAKRYNHTKWYTIDLDKLSATIKPVRSGLKKICSKSTNRSVETQPINNSIQRNNYTKRSSSIEDNTKRKAEEDSFYTKKEENKTQLVSGAASTSTEKIESSPECVSMISQQMVEAWNEEFRYSLSPIKGYKNDKTTKALYELYTGIFERDMERWRKYARHVNSSKFLMGEKATKKGFKAVFSWLIKEETVKEVLNGGYGVGDRELDMNRVENNVQDKKKEVIQKVSVKAICLLKQMILEQEEKKDFEEYVRSQKYLEDGDIYGMKCVFKDVLCSEQALREKEDSVLYMHNYENYITRKYLGLDVRGLGEKVKESLSPSLGEGLCGLRQLCEVEEKLDGIRWSRDGEPTKLLEGLLLSGLGTCDRGRLGTIEH